MREQKLKERKTSNCNFLIWTLAFLQRFESRSRFRYINR